MFGEIPGLPFKQFIQDCRVVVRPLCKYTNVIVKNKVHFVCNILLEHDQSTPKYGEIPDEDILDAEDTDYEFEPNQCAHNTASYAESFNPRKQSSVTNDPPIQTATM